MVSDKKSYRVVVPDRYLSVSDEEGTVTVRHEGEVVARSDRAVRLAEGDRPEVLYLPREDIDASRLVSSATRYRCRWKGEAEYFHVDLRDRTLEDVVWSYPDAPESLAALRSRVAFDVEAFDVSVGMPADGQGRDDAEPARDGGFGAERSA